MRIIDGRKCVSPSEIKSYTSCPRAHFKQSVLGSPWQSNINWLFGRSIHQIPEQVASDMLHGRQKPVDQYIDSIIADFSLHIMAEKIQCDIDPWITMIREIGQVFIPWLTLFLRPKETEKHVVYRLSDEYGIHGYVDYIDERDFIVDWKTAKSKPGVDWIRRNEEIGNQATKQERERWKSKNPDAVLHSTDHLVQIQLYRAALHQETGTDYKGNLCYITKQTTPQVAIYPVSDRLPPAVMHKQCLWAAQMIADSYDMVDMPMEDLDLLLPPIGVWQTGLYGGDKCSTCDVADRYPACFCTDFGKEKINEE